MNTESLKSFNNNKNMDGILTKELHGKLHQLSKKNFDKLVTYFNSGTLSSKDLSLLLLDLTRQEDMSKARHSQNSHH